MSFDYEKYAREMRKELSNDDMMKENGELNHEYFLHKKGAYFGDKEESSLLEVLREDKDLPIEELKKKANLQNFFDEEVELRIKYYLENGTIS